jgi:hypothetical protein
MSKVLVTAVCQDSEMSVDSDEHITFKIKETGCEHLMTLEQARDFIHLFEVLLQERNVLVGVDGEEIYTWLSQEDANSEMLTREEG